MNFEAIVFSYVGPSQEPRQADSDSGSSQQDVSGSEGKRDEAQVIMDGWHETHKKRFQKWMEWRKQNLPGDVATDDGDLLADMEQWVPYGDKQRRCAARYPWASS